MAFHFLAADPRNAPGIDFAARALLRCGVGLTGARITFVQIASLGPTLAATVVACVIATIGFGVLLARLMRRHWSFGVLTGGAVAICGASAALAISAVLPRRHIRDRDVLMTIAAVTGLSTVAMIAYPLLFKMLGFDDVATGILIGATIHDVAQVVGAGYSVSDAAGETATIVKLMRVALLPLVVGVLWTLQRGADGGSRATVPWFLLVFCALAFANSVGVVPSRLAAGLSDLSGGLLVVSIAALGIKTSLADMIGRNTRDLVAPVAITLFLLLLATGLVAF